MLRLGHGRYLVIICHCFDSLLNKAALLDKMPYGCSPIYQYIAALLYVLICHLTKDFSVTKKQTCAITSPFSSEYESKNIINVRTSHFWGSFLGITKSLCIL